MKLSHKILAGHASTIKHLTRWQNCFFDNVVLSEHSFECLVDKRNDYF